MKYSYLYPVAILLSASCSCENDYTPPQAPIEAVDFTHVKLNDNFWKPRIETNRRVTIPAALTECEKNGRFDNFAIAGGLMKGDHRGDFSFDDTDPYKVIEGASYSLAAEYDPALDAYLDSVISIIASAQEPDGYLTTCVTNRCERLSGWWGKSRWEKINSHELYNSGHLYEAAVAHFQATGKRTLLDVAIKNADLVCEVFGPNEGQIHRPSGHPIIEMALAKLYKTTGNENYLATAKYFVEETGRCTDGHKPSQYSQDHMPILDQNEIVGHAVRAGYLYSGVADVASLSSDSAYFNALERIWQNMASRKLYITGGIGSRAQGEGFGPDYELHNHTAYCETCAAIANVYWNYRMFLATGQSKYADICERALYNGVLSGVSLSGDKFFYDNPLESMGEHQRERWFGCACCPGNITRFIASVPYYMYARQADDIIVNMYATSTASIGDMELVQSTNYPWDGSVAITIDTDSDRERAIRLRIPGWAQGQPVPTDLYSYADGKSAAPYSVKVNGKKVKAPMVNGYATIVRKWAKGDKIELELPMEARQVRAHENVEDDRGMLAIERGPIVYCLEGIDQADGQVRNKFIPAGSVLQAVSMPDTLGGIVAVLALTPTDTLTSIPYNTWCNRGPGNMEVWIAESEEHASPIPSPTIASKAEMYSEPSAIVADSPAATSNLQWAWGYNDQWEPKSSSDTSKPYHYWWLRKGTLENVCYQFNEPVRIGKCDVYWLDFDHYDGDFRVPESWKLYYLDNGAWREVKLRGSEYGIEKDKYNTVAFEPVTTTALKISAQLQPGQSGGVIEWCVE